MSTNTPKDNEEFLFSLDGKCVFPFYYRNAKFYDCVMFKAKHKWCSLNETYQGYWKYCSEEGECFASEYLKVIILVARAEVW